MTRAPPHQVFSGLLSFSRYRSRATQGQAPGPGASLPPAILVVSSNTLPHSSNRVVIGAALRGSKSLSLKSTPWGDLILSFGQQTLGSLCSLPRNPQRFSLCHLRVSMSWIPRFASRSDQTWQLPRRTHSSFPSLLHLMPASVHLPLRLFVKTNRMRRPFRTILLSLLAGQVTGNRFQEFLLPHV